MPIATRHVPRGEGRQFHVLGGDQITIKASADDTDGAMTIIETVVPPGAGPPPHRHQREDELFYVLEGEFQFHVDGQIVDARRGDFLAAPRGSAHYFRNQSHTPGKLLILCQPGGFERFVEAFAQLPTDRPPDMAKLATLGAAFGIEFLPPSGP